jgi:hypothetical protein
MAADIRGISYREPNRKERRRKNCATASPVYYKDTKKNKEKELKVDHILMQWQGNR